MPLARMAMYEQGGGYLPGAHGRRARDVAGHAAPHRVRGPLLRPGLQPVRHQGHVPCGPARRRGLETQPEVMCRGGSAIVSPLGDVLAGPLFDQEGMLLADLDLGEVARARFDFDVIGHYARPDVFQLTVNEDPHRGLTRAPNPRRFRSGNEHHAPRLRRGVVSCKEPCGCGVWAALSV